MKKIIFLSMVVAILLIVLGIHLYKTANINEKNTALVTTLNQQKALIQEISKNIFYISKTKNTSSAQLDRSIDTFLKNLEKKDTLLSGISSIESLKQAEKIVSLWKDFYNDVKKFKKESKIRSPYSSILLEKTVRDIYDKNILLVTEIERLLALQRQYNASKIKTGRNIMYGIFASLFLLLIVILFYLSKINDNFDFLVKKIDKTIKDIQKIDNEAQEILENNTLSKKDDTIIEALDELIASSIRLKKLKKDLEDLKNLKSDN